MSLLLDGAVLVLLHPYRGRNPEAKNIAYYAGVRTIEYLQVPHGPSECRRADVCVCVHARVCARARVCVYACVMSITYSSIRFPTTPSAMPARGRRASSCTISRTSR